MLEKYYFNKYNQTDLNVYRCGIQKCKPKFAWGPGVRDHFIVHYILSGTGTFSVQNKSYHLTAGNGFVIFPEQLVTYTAGSNNPWTYSWVGFHGLKAESYLRKAGFSKEQPIFRYDNDKTLRLPKKHDIVRKAEHAFRINAIRIFVYIFVTFNP